MSRSTRPQSPSPQIAHAVADLIARGVALDATATLLGLDRDVLDKWIARGRAGDDRLCRLLVEAIDDAAREHANTVEVLAEMLRKRIDAAAVLARR